MIRLTVDEVGQSTLENLSVVDRLNEWMFNSIRPYVRGSILETGSGIGNISSCFIRQGIPLAVSDYSEHYCRVLREKFAGERLVNGIFQLDLADEHFEDKYGSLLGSFDTVYALNVVEHIKDDHLAVANCKKLLAPGGHLILLVPAWQMLYNGFDKELEHYRRYTCSSAKKLFQAGGFEVVKTWYFNLAGILGWFISGTILRKKTLPAGQLTFYNKLVPFFRFVDRLTFNRMGLSVIIVGKKGRL